MDDNQLLDFTRSCFVDVVHDDKASLIDTLNKNGFPTSASASASDVIKKSLDALQLSNSFKIDLVSLMRNSSTVKKMQNMKGFAAQPAGGGMITILTADDLSSDVNSNHLGFLKYPIFVDNCLNCQSFF